MVRESMVAREINFEEKRVYVPTLMVQEPFFSLPIAAVPIVQDTVVTAPVVSSPMAIINEHEEHVLQDPIEPVFAHEEEQQQPHMKQASTNETPEGLKEQENQPFLMTTKSMIVKNFKWREIPPRLKKP